MHKQILRSIVGSLLMVMGIGKTAFAASFNPAPLFMQVNSYSTTVTTNGDPTKIFFPVTSNPNTNPQKFPIALLLPGSRVEPPQYSEFAQFVASYGFIVVVPEHIRSLPSIGFTGFLPEASQINDVLAFMVAENSNPASPISGIIDTDKLALLGHSFGGAVGLSAIDNSCIVPLCEGQFQRPKQLQAGVFFGTSTVVGTGQLLPTRNQGIPTGLIVGSKDGLVSPELTQANYDLIQDPPKALITVDGANHYGITNINNPLGSRPDPNSPMLSQEQSIETIARWSAMFLRAYVLDDAGALDYLHNTGDTLDENVTVISQKKTVPESHSVSSLFLSMLVFAVWHLHSKSRI